MRKEIKAQINLFCNWSKHKFSDELRKISEVLEKNRYLVGFVYRDIQKKVNKDTGAEGMSAEQVLRAAILKQRECWSYEYLAYMLADSMSSRSFVILEPEEQYSASCLQENINAISEGTWDKVHEAIINYAKEEGIEKGRTVRNDSTVVKSNIHYPTDSQLLYDCVKVISRIFKQMRQKLAGFNAYPQISKKRAKELVLKIINSKNQESRNVYYRELIKGCEKLYRQTTVVIDEVDVLFGLVLEETNSYLGKVISQTRRRIIEGKKVKSAEKIVSIFESHTDIIVKGRRETEFGHKIFLTSGKSNLILDCQIEEGNPADSAKFMDMIKKQMELYGRAPRQTSSDGGFASQKNVKEAKAVGVKDVCFSKKCGLEVTDMVKSAWVFDKLRNFRAGIEGVISVIKRAFGLAKANWKGKRGFIKYVKSAIASYNLTVIARHLLYQEQKT